MTNFSIGRNPINFNLEDFLSKSAKVGYNMRHDPENISAHEPVTRLQVNLRDLKPTISKVDMPQIYMDVARCKTDEVTFLITSDFYVISDNNELVKKLVTTDINSTVLVKCVMLGKMLFDMIGSDNASTMVTHSISEDAGSGDVASGYGAQGPEQSGRMGDVKLPSVTASSEMPDDEGRGSGDMPTTKSKGRFMTISELRAYGKKYKKIDELLEHLEKEQVNENANHPDIKDLHFEDASSPDLHFDFFVNVPVIRKAAIIDTEFSCNTLEGVTCGKPGDFLVVGIDGEIYPCDAEIFNKTYQKVFNITSE